MKKPSIINKQSYVLSGNKILINADAFRRAFDKLFLEYTSMAYVPPNKEEILDFIFSENKIADHILSQIKKGIYTFELSLFDEWSTYISEFELTFNDGFNARAKYTINLDEIINYLEHHSKKSYDLINYRERFNKIENALLLKKIQIYTHKAFKKRMINTSKVSKKYKYSEVLLMLSENPDVFSKKLDSGEYGLEASKLCELLEEIDWYKLSDGFISQEKRDNIQKNVYYLLYNYQKYEEMEDPFLPCQDLASCFNLNKEIEDSIFSDMPEGFNDTEKVYYVYRKLCQLFTYSEDNFPSAFTTKPRSPEQLDKKKKGDYVACSEITCIFGNVLERLNIPFRIIGYDNHAMVKYNSRHLAIMIKTDEMIIHADPISRVIKNDISGSKFLHKTRNFNVWGNNLKAKVDLERYKQKVDNYLKNKYVSEDQKEAAELMQALKKTSKEGLSIKDKIDLAILFSRSIKLLPLDTVEWMDDLINELFGGDRTYFDYKVMKKKDNEDSKTKAKVCVCIAYNENGLDDTKNNVYQTIRQGNVIDILTFDELEENIENGSYIQTLNKMISNRDQKEKIR